MAIFPLAFGVYAPSIWRASFRRLSVDGAARWRSWSSAASRASSGHGEYSKPLSRVHCWRSCATAYCRAAPFGSGEKLEGCDKGDLYFRFRPAISNCWKCSYAHTLSPGDHRVRRVCGHDFVAFVATISPALGCWLLHPTRWWAEWCRMPRRASGMAGELRWGGAGWYESARCLTVARLARRAAIRRWAERSRELDERMDRACPAVEARLKGRGAWRCQHERLVRYARRCDWCWRRGRRQLVRCHRARTELLWPRPPLICRRSPGHRRGEFPGSTLQQTCLRPGAC